MTSKVVFSHSSDLDGESGSDGRRLVTVDGEHREALQRQEPNAVPLAVIETRT